MATERHRLPPDLTAAWKELAELRRFSGAPRDFWPRFLAALAGLSGAAKLLLLLREPGEAGAWKPLGDWSANLGPSRFLSAFTGQVADIASRCAETGEVLAPLEEAQPRGSGHYAAAVRLQLASAESCVAALMLSEVSEPNAREILLRLQLAADVPKSYQEQQAARQSKEDVESFAGAADLMASINAEKRFLAAALAFCNALASRFRCERVGLGWLERGYIQLRALSRTEKFDRKMAAAQALEAAMEEALDQDEEILWPTPEGAMTVVRDHERFAREQNAGHVCSVPLRVEGQPLAVLSCERQGAAFTPLEVRQLRLFTDQAARRLADLHRQDRWFGARWAGAVREGCAKLVGPQHTWAKVAAVLGAVLLAVLCFVRVPYRVEGNFVLRSDEAAVLTAPFDGYLDRVFVRPGVALDKGGRLLSLATAELELELSSAAAELGRFQRESEKARGARNLGEMLVAEALVRQAQSRLDLARHRLDQAVLTAPFAGVVIEGDLRERLAAPVKQGEPLLKLARTDTLYAEAEISERDVHEILGRSGGEIAFVSQPRFTFPVRLLAIEPAAFPRAGGNVFLVRCAFEEGAQPWWRPGMSGLCKLSVEKRTLLWILTHRTVDFLRLWLWW